MSHHKFASLALITTGVMTPGHSPGARRCGGRWSGGLFRLGWLLVCWVVEESLHSVVYILSRCIEMRIFKRITSLTHCEKISDLNGA